MPEQVKPKIRVEYVKSNHFRVVHVDGAWGGLGMNAEVQMALYSERRAIPKVVEYEVDIDEKSSGMSINKEVSRDGKSGLIREVELMAVMGPDRAAALAAWLIDRCKELSAHGIIDYDEFRKTIIASLDRPEDAVRDESNDHSDLDTTEGDNNG